MTDSYSLIWAFLGGAAFLALFFTLLQAAAVLQERLRSKALRKAFGGKATPQGFEFTIDGRRCRLCRNKTVVPLEVELNTRLGAFSIVSPRSVWGCDPQLAWQRLFMINRSAYTIAAENEDLLDMLTNKAELKILITLLFEHSDSCGMLLHTIPSRKGSLLCFNAFPGHIYERPDEIEGIVKKIIQIFDH